MKYFFDTEFIEGFHKPFLGKKRHFIDLISIGIVAEDGRKYYAISKEFNYDDADDWVKENVLGKIVNEYYRKSEYFKYMFDRLSSKKCIEYIQENYGKTNAQIKKEIIDFCNIQFEDRPSKIEFYAYFADYDWVLFCALFGRMIDLPTNYPQFCIDLKQMMVERNLGSGWKNENCPKSDNEHNALSDAIWNKKLYERIIKNAQ